MLREKIDYISSIYLVYWTGGYNFYVNVHIFLSFYLSIIFLYVRDIEHIYTKTNVYVYMYMRARVCVCTELTNFF